MAELAGLTLAAPRLNVDRLGHLGVPVDFMTALGAGMNKTDALQGRFQITVGEVGIALSREQPGLEFFEFAHDQG